MQLPTIEDIRAARERIAGYVDRTPLLRSDVLDAKTNARVFVKAECLQRGGAFKMRGATNKIGALSPHERARGVLAYSSGNHAIAVATVARLYAIPATIIMPADAPKAKIERTRAQGAEILFYDRVGEIREQIGARLVAERGLPLVKPFDDPFVIAGQGTIGLEIAEDIAPDIALAPASGGGLAGGIAIAMPHAKTYAVEPREHDDLLRSLETGEIVENAPGVRSICDALMAPRPSDLTFAVAQKHLAGALSVTDDEVRAAMRFAFEELKIVVEPGGAAALAAVLTGRLDLSGKIVAVVVSGGNVDAETFREALA